MFSQTDQQPELEALVFTDMSPSTPQNHWDDLVKNFPTIAVLESGSRCFWHVPDPSLDLRDDMEIGISLAKQTLKSLDKKHQNQGILAKILEKAPADCLIAKGFRMEIENTLFQLIFPKGAPVSN